MKQMKTQLLITAGIIIAFSSCVPKKKLISEQNRVKSLQNDSSGTHHRLNDCNSTVASMTRKRDSLQNELNGLANALDTTKANSQMKISELEATKAKSQMTIMEQAQRLNKLESLIQAQKDVLNNLKKTIADALINFKPDELTVYVKNGKLYVSLQEKLLFKSGSAWVGSQGRTALKTLATVLVNSPNIGVIVEGNTDTVPITGIYEDNWALSVARATAVVRILTTDYHVDPNIITASGKGKYNPVADNKTAEGRAQNRRTDIILSPNLSELFKLLEE